MTQREGRTYVLVVSTRAVMRVEPRRNCSQITASDTRQTAQILAIGSRPIDIRYRPRQARIVARVERYRPARVPVHRAVDHPGVVRERSGVDGEEGDEVYGLGTGEG